MSEAVDNVVKAWTVAGPYPPDHLKAQQDLRRDWPVLANALDELSRQVLKPHRRFGVGDRVVVADRRSRHNGLAGEIMELLPEDSIYDYRVAVDGGFSRLGFADSELAREPR